MNKFFGDDIFESVFYTIESTNRKLNAIYHNAQAIHDAMLRYWQPCELGHDMPPQLYQLFNLIRLHLRNIKRIPRWSTAAYHCTVTGPDPVVLVRVHDIELLLYNDTKFIINHQKYGLGHVVIGPYWPPYDKLLFGGVTSYDMVNPEDLDRFTQAVRRRGIGGFLSRIVSY